MRLCVLIFSVSNPNPGPHIFRLTNLVSPLDFQLAYRNKRSSGTRICLNPHLRNNLHNADPITSQNLDSVRYNLLDSGFELFKVRIRALSDLSPTPVRYNRLNSGL